MNKSVWLILPPSSFRSSAAFSFAITHIIMQSPALLLAFVWQPIVSPLEIWAGAAVLGALAIFAYVRTFRGRIVATSCLLAMRLALIAAIGILLMGPSSVPAEKEEAVRPKLRFL